MLATHLFTVPRVRMRAAVRSFSLAGKILPLNLPNSRIFPPPHPHFWGPVYRRSLARFQERSTISEIQSTGGLSHRYQVRSTISEIQSTGGLSHRYQVRSTIPEIQSTGGLSHRYQARSTIPEV